MSGLSTALDEILPGEVCYIVLEYFEYQTARALLLAGAIPLSIEAIRQWFDRTWRAGTAHSLAGSQLARWLAEIADISGLRTLSAVGVHYTAADVVEGAAQRASSAPPGRWLAMCDYVFGQNTGYVPSAVVASIMAALKFGDSVMFEHLALRLDVTECLRGLRNSPLPMQIAAGGGSLDCVKRLRKFGVRVSGVFEAARGGYGDVARQLLAWGEPMCFALKGAAEGKHPKLFGELLETAEQSRKQCRNCPDLSSAVVANGLEAAQCRRLLINANWLTSLESKYNLFVAAIREGNAPLAKEFIFELSTRCLDFDWYFARSTVSGSLAAAIYTACMSGYSESLEALSATKASSLWLARNAVGIIDTIFSRVASVGSEGILLRPVLSVLIREGAALTQSHVLSAARGSAELFAWVAASASGPQPALRARKDALCLSLLSRNRALVKTVAETLFDRSERFDALTLIMRVIINSGSDPLTLPAAGPLRSYHLEDIDWDIPRLKLQLQLSPGWAVLGDDEFLLSHDDAIPFVLKGATLTRIYIDGSCRMGGRGSSVLSAELLRRIRNGEALAPIIGSSTTESTLQNCPCVGANLRRGGILGKRRRAL